MTERKSCPCGNWSIWVGALKLGKWLKEIPGATSEMSVQNRAVLGTTKMLYHRCRTSGRVSKALPDALDTLKRLGAQALRIKRAHRGDLL